MNPTQQETQDAFQQLYDSLNQAYWSASTIETKDRIRGCSDVVYDILSQLTVDGIKSRSTDFQQLKDSVQSVNTKLKQLQKDIDTVIHNIQVATSVADGITKALGIAAKFLV